MLITTKESENNLDYCRTDQKKSEEVGLIERDAPKRTGDGTPDPQIKRGPRVRITLYHQELFCVSGLK